MRIVMKAAQGHVLSGGGGKRPRCAILRLWDKKPNAIGGRRPCGACGPGKGSCARRLPWERRAGRCLFKESVMQRGIKHKKRNPAHIAGFVVEARGVEPLTPTVNPSEQRGISCLCCISCCITAETLYTLIYSRPAEQQLFYTWHTYQVTDIYAL